MDGAESLQIPEASSHIDALGESEGVNAATEEVSNTSEGQPNLTPPDELREEQSARGELEVADSQESVNAHLTAATDSVVRRGPLFLCPGLEDVIGHHTLSKAD